VLWMEFERAAREIARPGRERLEAARLGLLGTLRRDGSPRISPVEPHVAEGHLLFAAMAWTAKAHDLDRDPRCVLHSVVSDPDGADGELKLYGRAEAVEHQLRDAAGGAWWLRRPPSEARVFTLDIEQAAFVTWDIGHGSMTSRRWSAERGLDVVERPYP
jgi:hypothetical protein